MTVYWANYWKTLFLLVLFVQTTLLAHSVFPLKSKLIILFITIHRTLLYILKKIIASIKLKKKKWNHMCPIIIEISTFSKKVKFGNQVKVVTSEWPAAAPPHQSGLELSLLWLQYLPDQLHHNTSAGISRLRWGKGNGFHYLMLIWHWHEYLGLSCRIILPGERRTNQWPALFFEEVSPRAGGLFIPSSALSFVTSQVGVYFVESTDLTGTKREFNPWTD